jgi:hypothetical protein
MTAKGCYLGPSPTLQEVDVLTHNGVKHECSGALVGRGSLRWLRVLNASKHLILCGASDGALRLAGMDEEGNVVLGAPKQMSWRFVEAPFRISASGRFALFRTEGGRNAVVDLSVLSL